MTNVFRGGGVDGVFRDICRVIADPLQATRNKHQVQIAAELLRIFCHALDESPAGGGVHFVEQFITRFYFAGERGIFAQVNNRSFNFFADDPANAFPPASRFR